MWLKLTINDFLFRICLHMSTFFTNIANVYRTILVGLCKYLI